MKIYRALLRLMRPDPWLVPTLVVLGLLSSILEGFGIGLFIPLLQSLNGSSAGGGSIPLIGRLFTSLPAEHRLPVAAFAIFAAITLKNAVGYSSTALSSWYSGRVGHRLRSDIHRQLLVVPFSVIERAPSGKLITLLATETWRTIGAITVFANLIATGCTIAVFAFFLLILSWPLTLIVSVLMVLVSTTVQLLKARVRSAGQQASEANTVLTGRMLEGLGGMRVIRAFCRESHEQERFERASERVSTVFFRMDALSAVVGPSSDILSTGVLALIVVLARPLLTGDQATLPMLITFIFLLYRLQPQIKIFENARIGLAALAQSVQEVVDFLADPPNVPTGRLRLGAMEEGIRFEQVGLCYAPGEKPALQDVSFFIPKGKTTALVGPSGAGKSTIASIIPRFYEISSGQITVDGKPFEALDLTDWRERIGIVSQDVYIFDATVRENIAYGRLDATDAQIVEAAMQANAHEFILQMPEGYDTPIGERGVRLSGGQRQRLAIARAIVRNPEILILDEATSALDSQSERLIQEALEKLQKDRTVIVIAHRLSTIESADQIVVLENGRVAEQGTFQQLMKLEGLYARLYDLQYGNARV